LADCGIAHSIAELGDLAIMRFKSAGRQPCWYPALSAARRFSDHQINLEIIKSED
jgi:hypothetical protein